jgi:hypothetical protein
MTLNAESGRRGNWRWTYGTHAWFPEQQLDFSGAVVSDAVPQDIPSNALIDSTDFLLIETGAATKRGGWSWAGPALTSATTAKAVAYADFPSGGQLVAVGDNGHIYKVTSGTTTDLGGSTVTTIDTPKFRIGGSKNLLIFPVSDGTTSPIKYDGSAAPASLGGTPPAGKFAAVYKSRLALGGSTSTPQRVYFSPTPDIESSWDTTNAWIDFDHAVTGMCALQNALLVFSNGSLERLLGSTPPPSSDMDRQPVAQIGCPDARAIAVWSGECVFANPRGVYLTNGTTVLSLTEAAGIDRQWRAEMINYSPSSSVLSVGVLGGYVFVRNSSSGTGQWMFDVARRKAWHVSNFPAQMWATSTGVADELYFGHASTNRIAAVSGIFWPSSQNASDGDGSAVQPKLTTRAFGGGPGEKAFGYGHVSYYMRSSGSPTLAVTTLKNSTQTTVGAPTIPESPLSVTGSTAGLLCSSVVRCSETLLCEDLPTDAGELLRSRFSVNCDAQAIGLQFAQSGASDVTQIFSIEIETRPYPSPAEGP